MAKAAKRNNRGDAHHDTPAGIGWLHLTDLHAGQPKEAGRLHRIEHAFLEDLQRVMTGEPALPIDLVFFSGDIAFRGSDGEFVRATALLGRILRRIEEINKEVGVERTPILLPAPGNHDLARPTSVAAESVRTHFAGRTQASSALWAPGQESIQDVIERSFAAYERWLQHPLPFPPGWARGVVPGDRSASVRRGGVSVGVLCLNTAYLHLGDDGPGGLHLDNSQVTSLCARLADWRSEHDFTVLVTHHPREWLSGVAQGVLDREILGQDSFDLHLFGHEHVGVHDPRPGTTGIRHLVQGRSLFGAEEGGGGRLHGYSVGRFVVDERRRIELEARRGWDASDGWQFGPVRDDGSGAWRIVIDGGVPRTHTRGGADTAVRTLPYLGDLSSDAKCRWKGRFAELGMPTKQWVFLSASVPYAVADPARRQETAAFVERGREGDIAEVVRGLARKLRGTGTGLVFGGHPSITQMLTPVVLEPGEDRSPWLVLFQHERFWSSFVEDVGVLASLDGVACVLVRGRDGGGELKDDLEDLRQAMLAIPGIVGAVFVGGLDGIKAEYKIVEDTLPDVRRFAIGVGGGAAAEILLDHGLAAAGHLESDPPPPNALVLPTDTGPLWHTPNSAVETVLRGLGLWNAN